MISIHKTAILDKGIIIGKGTKIWHFSHILKGTNIGSNCVIGQNCVIGPDVIIGNGCKIQNNVSIYKGVCLEEEVFCGPSVVFTNVRTPRAHINRKKEFISTVIKRRATIGANATIVCGNLIAEYAMIGAGAVVTKDVRSYALMVGVPAKRIGWVCECGEILSGSKIELYCRGCGKEYMIIEGNFVLKI